MTNPIAHLVTNRQLKKLRAAGLINEYRLRNLVIRQEFQHLRTRRKLKVYVAIGILSERHFVSFRQIENVVYKKPA